MGWQEKLVQRFGSKGWIDGVHRAFNERNPRVPNYKVIVKFDTGGEKRIIVTKSERARRNLWDDLKIAYLPIFGAYRLKQ